MPLVSESLNCPVMGQPGPSTKQVNARLPLEVVDGFDHWRDGHELQPTWTQIIEAALREYAAKRNIPLAAAKAGAAAKSGDKARR
jgi:hypothetical protein